MGSGRNCIRLMRMALLLAACFGFGCGSEDWGPDRAGAPPAGFGTPDGEQIGQKSEAVLTDAINVSENIMPNSVAESETAAVALGGPTSTVLHRFVAYNASDPGHLSGTNVCRFYAVIGASYIISNGWRGLRLPPPPGISILRGDPWVVKTSEDAAQYVVQVYSLAISDLKWSQLPKQPDGCISSSTYGNSSIIDAACTTEVVVPKDGTPARFGASHCFGFGSDAFDGGHIITTLSGNIYAAVWNTTRGRIDVFRNRKVGPGLYSGFSFFGSPLTNIKGHPVFVRHLIPNGGNKIIVVAPDTSGIFRYREINDTNSSWSVVRPVTAGHNWDKSVTLKNGVVIRQIGYAGQYVQGPGDAGTWLFFSVLNQGPGPTRIHGAKCVPSTAFPPYECIVMPTWITPATSNTLIPALTVAFATPSSGPTVQLPWLSYWDDNGSTTGDLTLMFAKIDLSNDAFTTFPTRVQQRPCPNNSYWGDYDQMLSFFNFRPNPLISRYVTDSTSGTCSAGKPQHVSEVIRTAN
jgi:hypothetical protein